MNLPSLLQPLTSSLAPCERSVELPPEIHAPGGPRQAAVLVLLYPSVEDVHFLLTVRPDTLPRHAGQVSLPGGRREPGDSSLWQTAARETREELGIEPCTLVALGRLEPVTVVVSNYIVTPFVAWSARSPILRPDPLEVAEVVSVPLRALCETSLIREERWLLLGKLCDVTFYYLYGHKVWGATGRILSDLARRLCDLNDGGTPLPGSVKPIPE